MFSPRQRPLLLVADRLLSLRLSINTPVVATDELPAGPARAAIAIHSEAGRTCFTVAVRSLGHGASVLYELDGEDFREADRQALALDASLSFGESMGFLFDDDLVVDRQPETLRRAVARLREIVSTPAPELSETTLHSIPAVPVDRKASEEDPEILLEEALEQGAVEPLIAAAPPPLSLTKFRAGPPPAASAPPIASAGGSDAASRPPSAAGVTGRGAMLGRVQPVRLRAPGTVPPLLRLLAVF